MREDATAVVERLERAAQRLAWAMLDVDPDDLNTAPGAGEWSPMQLFAHVKASSDCITLRLAMVLTHPHPVWQNFDERRWQLVAGYEEAPLDQTLLTYQRERQELVWLLRRLPDEAWDRTAEHETRGVLSLLSFLQGLVEHEEEHVNHLRDLLGIDEDEE